MLDKKKDVGVCVCLCPGCFAGRENGVIVTLILILVAEKNGSLRPRYFAGRKKRTGV
jgi:hypothetical protein